MSNSIMRRTIITLVLLVLFALPASVAMAQWLDNTTNISDDDVTNNVRTSSHFRMVWGIQPTSGVLIDEDFIQTNLQNLEYDYKKDHTAPSYGFSFYDPSVPNPADGHNYRANLYINNTHGSPDEGFAYGWTDGRNLAEFSICAEGLNPLDPPSDVHPHEYGHGNIIGSGGLGSSGEWHEGTANWFSQMRDDDYNDPIAYSASWFPYPHGRDYYDSWPIYEAFREDPNFGPTAISNGFTAGGTDYIFTAIAKQATYTADKLDAEKKVFGEYAVKSVNYDFQRGEFYRKYDNWDPRYRYVYLQKEPGSSTLYRCPWAQAPSQGGYNVIPLSATAGTTVTVNFKGASDSLRESDWRVCLVAISNNGNSRYSRFWNCGSNSITLSSDESQLYLVVAATPDFYSVSFDRDLQTSMTKEPLGYEVSFTNATPIEPTNGGAPGSGWHQHSNGGGWVQDTATVDSTAYVGPNARVSGSAQVKNSARIDDYAVVQDSAQVRDNAIVSGHALVCASAQVYGNAKVRDWAKAEGNTLVYGNARLLEHGHVIENVAVYDNACVRGYAIWYGTGTIVLNGYAIADGDACDGSNLDHGTSTGWSWGPNQAYNDALPDSGGIFCQYKFDNPDPAYAKDTYGMAWGYMFNKPTQPLIADTYRATVLQLDGSSQYIECPKNLIDIKDTTIAVWVYWTGTANDQRIFSFGDGANKYMYLTPKDTTNGKVKFVISNNGTGGEQTLVGAAAITASRWTHIAITLNGNTGTLYVDGTSVATNSSMTLNPDDLMNPNTLAYTNCNYIGKGNSGNYYQGYIDDFRLYSLAKAAGDITTMAGQFTDRSAGIQTTPPSPTTLWYKFDETTGSTAADSSGSGKNGTCNGGYTWGAGKINNCITLNGSTGYVTVPNLSSSVSQMTITTWVYVAGIPGGSGWAGTALAATDGWGTGDIITEFIGTGGNDHPSTLQWAVANAGVSLYSNTKFDSGSGNQNKWIFVALTFDGVTGTAKIFINGVLDNATTGTAGTTADLTQLKIGSWGGNDRFLNGKVDDFRIYNRALSDAEIALFMPGDTSAPTPNPAIWLINPTAASDTSVAMSATKASDGNGVEYSFTCTAGGGHSSGWISTNQYTDNGLTPGTQYTYTVQTRDSKGNTGTASSAQSATPASDTSAPTPNPATFAIAPKGVDTSSITMTATKGTDTNSLVEYKFTGSNGHASSWQASPTWTDTGLTSGATATYTVQMRDGRGNTGTASAASPTATVRDETPPHIPGATYDPITSPWYNRPVVRTNGTLYMTARTATDVSGVQYYFHCSSGGGPDSGWQDSEHWTSAAVANGTYTYQMKARDKSAQANETGYVGSETVTVTNNNIYHSYTVAQVLTAADGTLVSFTGTVTAVASNYYTVTNGGSSVKVIPDTYNQATNSGLLNKAVSVKGCMWTFTSLGKVVNFGDVQYPIHVWYKFDETSGTTAADSGGLGFNATVTSPTWTAGKINNCLQFNGTATYASVPSLKTMSAFSMGGWLYVSGMSADYSSMIFGSTSWGTSAIHFQIRSSDGDVQFSVGGAGDVFTNFKFAGANLNQWVHVFATYDSATKAGKVYINGAVDNSATFGSSVVANLATAQRIGMWGGGENRYFNGKMDEFHIYDYALSDPEVAALYSPPSFTITASAGTGGTISPSGAVSVPQGGSQTFTITPNSGYIISSVTVDGTNVGGSRTYTFTNVQANHTIAAAFVANTDLMAYWKFDETSGTTAYDSTANAKNATLNGSCTWVAGLTNNAVNIPGGTSYVGVPTGIVYGLTNFTIVTWVKLTSRSTNMRIFDFGSSTTKYMMITPQHSSTSGKIQYYIRNGSTNFNVTGTAALPTGSWQQVAVTQSGNTVTLYVQGSQVGQITNCTLNPNSLGSTTNNRIGDSQSSSHPHLNGAVDGFRIYNRCLTGPEITALYNGGAGPASVDGGNDPGWVIIPAK